MNNNTKKGPVTVLGIDLAKQSFQLHGVDDADHSRNSIKKIIILNILRSFCMSKN
jgi:hypothetical protein